MKFSDYSTMSSLPVIYGILNTVTNKWYIGSTSNLKDRIRRHYYYLRHNSHHSSKLQRSFNLHGEDSFTVEILHIFSNGETAKEMFLLEEKYIKDYNAVDNGYNMISETIVCTSFSLTEEQKDKAGASHKIPVVCINRFTGQYVCTYDSLTEAAAAIGDQTTNISNVCEHKKLRYVKDYVFCYESKFDSSKNYKVEHHCKGIPKSNEQRQKMILNNARRQAVDKLDMSGNIVSTYSSRSEAEKQNGFKREYLRRRLGIEINGYVYRRSNKKI